MDIEFELNGESFKNYSEDDTKLNDLIAADIIQHHMQGLFGFSGYETNIFQSKDVSKLLLKIAVDIIEQTIGKLYLQHNGRGWKREKKVELSESGLIFVFIADPKTNNTVAFMCFKLCPDTEDQSVLYLYEIHVTSEYQGRGLGQILINKFHELAIDLKKSSNSLYKRLTGTALTVFSNNERTLSWYKNMNYSLTADSPLDKVLRHGNVLKPDYYLLKRPLII